MSTDAIWGGIDMVSFGAIVANFILLSSLQVGELPRESTVYGAEVETFKTCIRSLPCLARLKMNVVPYKRKYAIEQYDKLPIEEQRALARLSGMYEANVMYLTDRHYPVTANIYTSAGKLVRPSGRPDRMAYGSDHVSEAGYVRKEWFWVGARPEFIQYFEVRDIDRHVSGDGQITFSWYRLERSNEAISTSKMPIRMVPMQESDRVLLQDFMEQPEYKSPNRRWIMCELNYGKIRDKLSNQAREQLVVFGFLRAIIKANKVENAPVLWLEDAPEFLVPLTLTLRLEVALAEQDKKLADQLEKRIETDAPGMYWEVDRIKKGKGQLATMLKAGYGNLHRKDHE